MTSDWFRDLTGFPETSYAETRRNLEVAGSTLRSKANDRSFAIGELETPSLAELRTRAVPLLESSRGRLALTSVVADVARLHRDPAHWSALFQVASQFNLLEMTGPGVSPEAGVTRYVQDPTQGPACAMAAGAATIYRNYFAPVGDQVGQTRDRQIDCLSDIGAALGNDNNSLWAMMNGYALCSEEGLALIDRKLEWMGEPGRDAFRDKLRIGLHWDVEVTGVEPSGLRVSQAFCSALPVSYTPVPADRWASFASIVLEGAYEATMSAVLNAARFGSNVVFLTQLGGGAFGNPSSWILAALRRALDQVQNVALDVRIVSYRQPDRELLRLVNDYSG